MRSPQRPVSTPQSSRLAKPLISTFADDAEILELVEEFVDTLPAHVEELETALAQADLETLVSLAHQLKGTGGGFGFGPITDAAGGLEAAARDADDPGALIGLVDALVTLCRRARATAT